MACVAELAEGRDTREQHLARCTDERSFLVVEPLRWALALGPEWVALEQVPPVLELYEQIAGVLERRGYNTWTGVLEAERYGIPQTRERAFLLASRVGPAVPPRPTHQRYVPGEPPRHEMTLEGEVLPWGSMAEALGWVDDGRCLDRRQSAPVRLRPVAESAPTLQAQGLAKGRDVWVYERPAPPVEGRNVGGRNWLKGEDWPARRPSTTITGDSRVFQPGGHHEPGSGRRMRCASRCSKQYEQVGNAVPPPLARAVLAALVGGIEHTAQEEVAA